MRVGSSLVAAAAAGIAADDPASLPGAFQNGNDMQNPYHIVEPQEVIWAWGTLEGDKGVARPDNWTSVTEDHLLYNNHNITKLTFLNIHLPTIGRHVLPSQLQDIAIANCDLTTVPHDIVQMPHLTKLDLNRNNIPSVNLPVVIYSSLTQINMQENMLTAFNISAPNLIQLDLTSNQLTTIPSCVYTMMELLELYLTKNSISLPLVVSSDEFEFLSGLDYFYMDLPVNDTASCPGESQLHVLKGNKLCVQPFSSSTNRTSIAAPATSSPDAASNWTYSTLSWILLVSGILEAIIGVGVYLVYRKQKLMRRQYVQHGSSHATSSGERERLLSVEHVLYASMEAWTGNPLTDALETHATRLDCDALTLDKRLAQGGYGEVWLGHYHASLVAIKLLLPEKRSIADIEAFVREIVLLASLDHPHIVHCIGAAWPKSKRDLMLVTEYVAGGDLRALLDVDTTQRDWPRTKVQYAIDIAHAMEYMHALEIVHRDLKAKNVLIDPTTNGAKVCDFGVATHLHQLGDPTDVTLYGFGTSRWIAPEVLTGDAFTKAADVYAFGIVLSELDSHQIPFANARTPSGNDMTNVAILQQVVKGTMKPTFGDSCPREIATLASLCLHPNPKARPTASTIVATLVQVRLPDDES
ncbi:Aste57867_18023 [Aphanomyces stellatus]|uniref:Aste57867_18023 protein n=1 Tax=Aphanomyces stellatus TaxID=120398 RepID=A0A485L907_9STRA|nr:hypothetical protein As57867_017961 [Aphanomyces stellatus]VFT94762.1 Aste57867_18023 [Aphanomyces stellatus]